MRVTRVQRLRALVITNLVAPSVGVWALRPAAVSTNLEGTVARKNAPTKSPFPRSREEGRAASALRGMNRHAAEEAPLALPARPGRMESGGKVKK
jgi:hypothetical protein